MRIVYIGSVIFSAKALEKLISIKADVVGVVTKNEFAKLFCRYYRLS